MFLSLVSDYRDHCNCNRGDLDPIGNLQTDNAWAMVWWLTQQFKCLIIILYLLLQFLMCHHVYLPPKINSPKKSNIQML